MTDIEITVEGGTQKRLLTAGKYCDRNIIVSATGGSIVDSGGQYLVQVIDYDGTVLKQDHLNEGDTFTLPDAPERDSRLVFQGWSSPVDIVNNTVTVGNSDITIGAMYKTASGASEFDITLTKVTGKTVTFQGLIGMTSIDWGDGITNSSLSHTYANEGDYTVKVYGVTALNASIFGQGASSSQRNHCLKTVRLAETVKIMYDRIFWYCLSLTKIAIPKNITSVGTNSTFASCYSLKSIVIPNSVTSFGSTDFFDYCYSLKSIVIPNSVTSISSSAFTSCYSLKSIVIPNSVTSISSSAFSNCTSIIIYDFTNCTEVPVLSSTSVFTGINAICKILVPASLYDEWIAATNWATYADYIYPVEV